MCGIAGYWEPKGVDRESAARVGKAMGATLVHRGPDSGGIWIQPEAGLVLAHQRLAVVDLTDAGAQPMHSPRERYTVVFNGEIYNHQLLRRDPRLRDVSWRGNSDTETLLAYFETFGIEGTVERASGMFAFAAWDHLKRTLTLGRDRLGEKPLYYGVQNGVLLFASELRALRAHPSFKAVISQNAVHQYALLGYIPGQHSIFENIHKLLPGHLVRYDCDSTSTAIRGSQPIPYWRLDQVVQHGETNRFSGSIDDAVDELDRRLRAAVGAQMLADVPIGAFLSGGTDSSTIVSMMQAQNRGPVKTFSIGFDDSSADEAHHAAEVARFLGTEHTEERVTARRALEIVPRIGEIYDEPFADSSSIPTWLVSYLARRKVTVSLSGDGGDELFCGYHRYFQAGVMAPILGVNLGLRQRMATGFRAIAEKCGCRPVVISTASRRLRRVATLMESADKHSDLYLRLTGTSIGPGGLLTKPMNTPPWTRRLELPAAGAGETRDRDIRETMMYIDSMAYLPDDILVKVDRAAMNVALETRVPFLDKDVVEFAWSLPISMKSKGGTGKVVLKKLLYRYLPRHLVDRAKKGFAAPVAKWLHEDLRDWAGDLLSPTMLSKHGLFDINAVQKSWTGHQHRTSDNSGMLWPILMFQLWYETHMSRA